MNVIDVVHEEACDCGRCIRRRVWAVFLREEAACRAASEQAKRSNVAAPTPEAGEE